MSTREIFMIVGFFFLSACASKIPTSGPELRLKEVAKERELQAERVRVSVSQAPEWYIKPPTSGAALYSVGEAMQRNLTLARRASLNQAKVGLAEKFASYTEGFDEQYLDGQGEEFKTGAKTAFNQKLVGFEVLKRETIENNGMVQTYVLLEYPIGEANRLIVGEVRKHQTELMLARKNKGFRAMEEKLDDVASE